MNCETIKCNLLVRSELFKYNNEKKNYNTIVDVIQLLLKRAVELIIRQLVLKKITKNKDNGGGNFLWLNFCFCFLPLKCNLVNIIGERYNVNCSEMKLI